MHIAIIGGGAAGCFAAVNVKRLHPEAEVTVYEAATKPLVKVSITGGGRCNLTNRELGPEHYHGEQPEFALPALRASGTDS